MTRAYKKAKYPKKNKSGGQNSIGIGISIGSDSKRHGGCISEKDEGPPRPKPTPGPNPWPPRPPRPPRRTSKLKPKRKSKLSR
jgi:hypothetical protein